MATKVQSKTYFPGSMMDLNNGFWDSYHDDRASGSESHCYESFFMRQTMDGYSGYAKEQMRQTILKQDSIFRHQLHELHRLYERQRYLMNEHTMKEHYNFSKLQMRVIDLELPADEDEDNEGKQPVEKVCNLADLNEPIQMDESPFAPANSNSGLWYLSKIAPFPDGKTKCYNNGVLQAESKKAVDQLSRKRTIFGVELCERSHTPSFDSSQSSSWDQNTSTFHHNHWLDDFTRNKHINNGNSRLMTTSRPGVHQEPHEKHNLFNVQTTHENLEKKLPSWLMGSSSCDERMKVKETMVYQMNMDSLQHHSQKFFKKSEMMTNGGHDSKVQTNNRHVITKILGVPIVDIPENSKDHDQTNGKDNLKYQIDLNMSFDEEEARSSTPYIPESVVKIATMEIDLEAPATLESETDLPDDVSMDDHEDLVKAAAAAEAIISISSSTPPPEEAPAAADTLLRWFAEVIAYDEKDLANEVCIPEGMDYLEYMTLKLQETKEECYYCYTPVVTAEKEEDEGLLKKRAARKGQGKRGRQKKDFRRDVLPGIVSLSRREVTEDIQTFEEAFSGIGDSWESTLLKRKAAGKNGRGRRRLVASNSPPPPPPPPPAVEQSVCREVALEEKSLSGWGKRTRRLPRQRCQNGGNHQSFALKC